MGTVVLLRRGVKNSVLDRAMQLLHDRGEHQVESLEYGDLRASELPTDVLVLVRNSELVTDQLERQHAVYPHQEVRLRSKNKWLLHLYCLEQGIPTPQTIRASELSDYFVFKRTVGSNHSVVEPFAGDDLLMQERLEGQVVKSYGTVQVDSWLGFDETTRQEVPVPKEIGQLGQRVLEDFGLVWGGLDWLIDKSRWVLLDVNATSGLGSVPITNAVAWLSNGLRLLRTGHGTLHKKHTAQNAESSAKAELL